MDSIDEYFQYVSLSIYGCFMDCVGSMGLLAWWVWLVGLFEMRWLYSHALVGGKAGLPLNWGDNASHTMSHVFPTTSQSHAYFVNGTSPPPHLHTNPEEENENSLVLTITTTKHIWKNVGSWQDVFKNTIFQVSCINILSENVGALFLYFTNNWQV